MTVAFEYDNPDSRECAEIEGYLSEGFYLKLIDSYPALRIGESKFRPLFAEEYKALGYLENDERVLIARESDGQVFEIEIDVTAWKLKDKTVAWEAKV